MTRKKWGSIVSARGGGLTDRHVGLRVVPLLLFPDTYELGGKDLGNEVAVDDEGHALHQRDRSLYLSPPPPPPPSYTPFPLPMHL